MYKQNDKIDQMCRKLQNAIKIIMRGECCYVLYNIVFLLDIIWINDMFDDTTWGGGGVYQDLNAKIWLRRKSEI